VEFGDAAEVKAGGEFVSEEVFGVFESGEGFLFLARVGGYFHVGVAHVGGDVGGRYGDGFETRVFHLETDDFGELFFNGFGNSAGSVVFHLVSAGESACDTLHPVYVGSDQHRAQLAGGFLFHSSEDFLGEVAA